MRRRRQSSDDAQTKSEERDFTQGVSKSRTQEIESEFGYIPFIS